jgi:hypothetical protein
MLKIMLLLHRRQDLSAEEFRTYWHGQHRALLERLPGLRRLVLNDTVRLVEQSDDELACWELVELVTEYLEGRRCVCSPIRTNAYLRSPETARV